MTQEIDFPPFPFSPLESCCVVALESENPIWPLSAYLPKAAPESMTQNIALVLTPENDASLFAALANGREASALIVGLVMPRECGVEVELNQRYADAMLRKLGSLSNLAESLGDLVEDLANNPHIREVVEFDTSVIEVSADADTSDATMMRGDLLLSAIAATTKSMISDFVVMTAYALGLDKIAARKALDAITQGTPYYCVCEGCKAQREAIVQSVN